MADIIWHNSAMNTLRECEAAFAYRYIKGWQAPRAAKALEMGLWVHACLAAHYLAKGHAADTLLDRPTTIEPLDGVNVHVEWGDTPELAAGDTGQTYPLSWKGMLSLLTDFVWVDFAEDHQEELSEEVSGEKMSLPQRVDNLVTRYLFHRRKVEDITEEVLLVEHEWTRPLKAALAPGADKEVLHFGGRVDLLLRDTEQDLLVVRDWKTSKSPPSGSYRLIQSQTHLYAWGIAPLLHGLDVGRPDAVEFDYLVSRIPSKPRFTKAGNLYANTGALDAYTLFHALAGELRETGDKMYDPRSLKWKKELKERADDNPFFFRHRLPVNERAMTSLMRENVGMIARAREIMDGERQPTRLLHWFNCDMCSFKDLCVGELYGNDVSDLTTRMTRRIHPLPLLPAEEDVA